MHVPTAEQLVLRAKALESEIGAGRTHEALAVITQRIDHEIRMLSERLWENRKAAEELIDQERAAERDHYAAQVQQAIADGPEIRRRAVAIPVHRTDDGSDPNYCSWRAG